MQKHSYTAQDALTYILEKYETTLLRVHERLAELNGVEEHDGEIYLPPQTNSVMEPLYVIARDLTDLVVEVGAYRRVDGVLRRPCVYSHGGQVQLDTFVDVNGESEWCLELQHPSNRTDVPIDFFAELEKQFTEDGDSDDA